MSDTTPDVIQGPSPVASEGVITQPPATPDPVVPGTQPTTPLPPGAKTPPENLLAALRDERQKNKELEDKIKDLTTTAPSEIPEDEMSDEGRALKNLLDETRQEVAALKDEKIIGELQAQYPVLKDKATEFDEFRKEYPRHKLENVAKIFVAEHGLLEAPERKGLERPTGGPKTPPTSKLSVEEIKRLRETDSRKYTKMLLSGEIRPEDMN